MNKKKFKYSIPILHYKNAYRYQMACRRGSVAPGTTFSARYCYEGTAKNDDETVSTCYTYGLSDAQLYCMCKTGAVAGDSSQGSTYYANSCWKGFSVSLGPDDACVGGTNPGSDLYCGEGN